MNKRTIGIVIGIVLAVAGFWFLTTPSEEVSGTPTSHTKGEGTSGVVLVEYADFQCPACAQYYPVLQQVKAKYGDTITFQLRHFPLEAIHKNARAAARAAEAAGLQGKFWEMHDVLYERQQIWQETNDPIGVFEGYAREIGVDDMAKFSEDYKSSTVNASINADLDAGRDLGVQSTPTFILDGKKLEENPGGTVEAFSLLIDEAIRARGGTPPSDDSSAAGSTEPTTIIEPSTETPNTQQ